MGSPRKPRRPCAICGRPVRRPTNIYCTRACRDEGLRRNPNGGSFLPGQEAHNREPVGTVKIHRRYSRLDGPRAVVKVAEPDVWRLRAVVVWEEANGPLPKGKIVHHKDRDSLNDETSNLLAVTKAEHLREHRADFEPRRAEAASTARWGHP